MTTHVLIVDDSKVSRMLIKAMMSVHHPEWHYHEADSGDAALQLIATTPVDLVTMDVNMPGINGIDAAAQIRTRLPEAFIAVLSANVQSSTRQRAEQLGAHFYGKPVTEAIVAQVVRSFDEAR